MKVYQQGTLLFLLGACIGTFSCLMYFQIYNCIQPPTDFKQTKIHKLNTTDLVNLANEIVIAKRHVRGTKTGYALFRANEIIKKILLSVSISYEKVTKRKVVNSTSVCAEIYKGSTYGHPQQKVGFLSENCTFPKPLKLLVTVLIVYKKENISQLEILLFSAHAYSAYLPLIVNVLPTISESANQICMKIKNCFTTVFTGNDGVIWNKMLKLVKTPYVLIGRDIHLFTEDVRLDRLIRQIERLQVSAAGGSFRNATGHWFIGCQQSVLRNYTLVYEAGYDESIEECQFCDHIDGPFIISTNTIKKIGLNSKIDEGVFEDFFLNLKNYEKIVCPDSMFFTSNLTRSIDKEKWSDFANVRKLRKMSFSGFSMFFPCINYTCHRLRNGALTPCCMKELADLLNTLFEACKKADILCLLHSGSVMGSVKFNSILPWEKDGDIMFLSSNYTALLNTSSFLKQKGYRLHPKDTRKYSKNVTSGGFFLLRSKHWYIECWGMSFIGTMEEIKTNQAQTKLNVNGHWLGMLRNPGLYARNRYGHEIYQHAQHWSETGLNNSWKQSKTNYFKPCGKPGHHSCLDTYNGDGNLQFRDPIP